eukprot:1899899-Prymnesium_polylepis.1
MPTPHDESDDVQLGLNISALRSVTGSYAPEPQEDFQRPSVLRSLRTTSPQQVQQAAGAIAAAACSPLAAVREEAGKVLKRNQSPGVMAVPLTAVRTELEEAAKVVQKYYRSMKNVRREDGDVDNEEVVGTKEGLRARAVNMAEKITGRDLDGDGDVNNQMSSTNNSPGPES